jgi:flavin reductase (DIM6/NTAB) family NADH-FMN oxidoreductase RutF
VSVGGAPQEPVAPAVDPREFRRIMGTFATGVTVVTMPTAQGAWGMTANSLTSISLEPLLLLVSVDKSTRTHQFMLDSGIWAVNILSDGQEAVSRAFATKDQDEARTMVGTPYRLGKTGAPLIDGCLAYVECKTWATYDGGDHTLFIGEVQDAAVTDAERPPLLFFRGRYGELKDS